MPHDVSEFIVMAPASMGKIVDRAEHHLLSYLDGHFPFYRFRVEPFGPFADEEDFTIVPIMNRPPAPGEATMDPDATFMCHLDPNVIPEIQHVLRSFDPSGIKAN